MKRQQKENSEQFLRRFLREIQEQGIVTEAKERMFYSKKENKRARREKALERKKFQIQRQKQLKGY